MDGHAITRAPVPDRRPLRGLRLLGLVGLLLFAVAAFTPLANRLNIWMAGLAPVLVLSGSAEETQARARLAQGLGVPSGAILRVAPTHTTKGEAEALRRLLLPLGRRRILLVADPIDMPRARAVMERAGFTVLPAPTAATGPSDPQSRLGLLRDIVSELAGWMYYRLAGVL